MKVASPELNYTGLLRQIASYGLPVLLSAGVSKLGDIEEAPGCFNRDQVCLLHCVTACPAPETDYNLRVLGNLAAVFGVPLGLSDHSGDPELVPALGAVAAEKHFCLSRQDPGLDDPIALPPEDFRRMVRAIRRVSAFFGDKKLNCVTTNDLKKLSNELAGRGLSTSSINQILLIVCTPPKWAFNEKIIPANPVVGLTRFSITNKERGILTETEAAEVFSVEREDKRAAPLLPEVRAALLDLLRDNPRQADDPFVFYSLREDRPVDPKVILGGLHTAIDKLNARRKEENPDAEIIDWKGRGIVFHSWRHYFCSLMTDVLDGEKIAKVSGHLSENIFKKYSDHVETKNIAEVSNAAAQF